LKLTLSIFALLILADPVFAIDEPVVIDSLLTVASDTTRSFDERVRAVKRAAGMDDTGRSHAAHARLLMNFPSPDHMVAAQTAAKKAIKKDRKNAEYLGLMAELLWRIGRRTSSIKYAERAIEANSTDPIGHYWAGRFHFWETMKYLWMSRVETNTDSRGYDRTHTIDMGHWGEESRVKTESAFKHVLNLEPEHEAARRYLGLIYYQTRRSKELRELFKSVVQDQPDNPTGFFTVGMSYHLERDYERAYRAYSRGLSRMSQDEQRFMLAVFTDDRTDPIDTLPDMKTLQRFWIGKDPLFMSPVNERMLEQCRRVAYVNLRYGEPEKGIAGWSTDRGQAYIRYGDPLVLQARPPEFDTHIDDPIVLQRYRFRDARWFGTSSDQYRFGKELWEYENFVLVFDNTDTRDSWKFRIASLDGAIVGLNDLVERVPHRFVDPFKDRRFEVTYQIGQFRGAEGKTRIEIYYAVPAAKVDAETAKGLGTVDLEKGLFLFSADWDTLVIQKHQVDRLAWVRDRSYSKGYLLSGEVLNLEPGSYHVAGEVVDRKSDAVGGFRTALRVRAFSQDSLEISSILLARRIVEKPERPFGRDQYVILPNPVGATARNKKAYFYFEVYNLARNEFGRTHYQVTYQTKSLPTGGADSEPDWVTAVTQEVTGDHTWEPVYLALELQGAQPGLRNFRVIIEDKLSSQEASASTQYRIRW
jgi:GWxTD domain-containing protein